MHYLPFSNNLPFHQSQRTTVILNLSNNYLITEYRTLNTPLMNYIKHLTGFFEKVVLDRALNPTHISLYIALFQFWNCNRFRNPISINRDEIMRISKISSKATYHKCLKNLHSLGYINYEPSYNPFKGSHVFLFNFADDLKPLTKSEKASITKNEPIINPLTEQAVNKSSTSDKTSNEQELVSYINNTNKPNISNDLKIVNLDEQAKNFIAKNEAISNENNSDLKNENLKEEKSFAKKEEIREFVISSEVEKSHNKNLKPSFQEVISYFHENRFPELEAQKFFNYFSSIGWLVGGKTPMVDWQAAAQNWILNAPKFINESQSNRAKNLTSTTNKDYSEPL